MKKIVTSGEQDCTVQIDGTECAVVFSSNYRCFTVQNDTAGDIYISISPNITAGKDGVRRVASGASSSLAHGRNNIDTLYILGTGRVQVTASDSPGNFFKPAPAAGGGEIGDISQFFAPDKNISSLSDLIKFWIDNGDVSDTRMLIPKMSDNVGQYGVASCNSDVNYNGSTGDATKAYYAFDQNDVTNLQYYTENQSGGYVQYEFNTPVSIVKMSAKIGNYAANNVFNFYFQYYDDTLGEWKNYGNEQTITGTTFTSKGHKDFVVTAGTVVTTKIRLISNTLKTVNTNWIVYEFQAYSGQ